MVEKRTGYPHDGNLPLLPGNCMEKCSRGMVDAARDRRTHVVRPLRGERHTRWEDHVLVPCPVCRPEEFDARVESWQPRESAPDPSPEEITAIIARSPLAASA